MRCPICEDKIPGSFPIWRNAHITASHPLYSVWLRRWFQTFFTALVPFLFVMVVSDYLWAVYGGFYGYIAGIVIVLFFAFVIYDISWVRNRKQRRFKRAWKDTHNQTPRETEVQS